MLTHLLILFIFGILEYVIKFRKVFNYMSKNKNVRTLHIIQTFIEICSQQMGATGRLMVSTVVFVGTLFISGPRADGTRLSSASDIEAEQVSLIIGPISSDAAFDAERLVQPIHIHLTVGPGDTLMAMLVEEGIKRSDAHAAISAMSNVYKPRNLKPKQDVIVTAQLGLAADQPSRLEKIELAATVERNIIVSRSEDNGYKARVVDRPLKRNVAFSEGNIELSLYGSAVAAAVPLPVLAKMVQIFSFDVDFQRDIRRGDKFSLMYSRYSDESDVVVREGKIHVATLMLGQKELRYYQFKTNGGQIDYFNEQGHSARKALLRTPIDGARISSSYGMRRHPILGYNKMHRGLDFAAPIGTRIYAAGNGIVERALSNGAYGKYVRIRHNSTYKTAYAHLSRYGKNIRPGRRVKQGQTIGYVGTTGRSTGPHLHYEVITKGVQVNPRRIKLPTGRKLAGAELAKFRKHLQVLKRQHLDLRTTTRLAKKGKDKS